MGRVGRASTGRTEHHRPLQEAPAPPKAVNVFHLFSSRLYSRAYQPLLAAQPPVAHQGQPWGVHPGFQEHHCLSEALQHTLCPWPLYIAHQHMLASHYVKETVQPGG